MDGSSVAHALARAGTVHRARAAALLARIDLHPGQEFLLAALDRNGPCAIGELAAHLGVEQPTITKMVRRLEPGGLVERSPDPDDGRRTLVRLTDDGRRTLADAYAVWAELDQETTAALEDAEAAELRRLLGKVRAGLCGEDPSDW